MTALEVILSITRESTTYTTTIGLTPSTALASVPTELPAPGTTLAPARNPDTPNTGVVVGAVLGSILGALVLMTLFYKCCVDNRSALHSGERYSSYDSDSESGRSSHSSGVRARGGGFDHRNVRVRSPHRARTRRHREINGRSDSRSVISWGSRNRRSRRRRSSMIRKNGMLGWRLTPKTNYHNSYERRWPRTTRDEYFSPDD